MIPLPETGYRLDRALMRNAAVNVDTEAERLTERLQVGLLSTREKRAIVERRAKLWQTAKLLREIAS